jgi:hypothetical protein
MMRAFLQELMPFTAKMNPFDGTGNNFKYLIATGMFSRCLVGLTRIITDAPPFNPNTYSQREKDRNFLERIFIEVGGTFFGTFVALHTCMDVASKGFSALDKRLAPQQLLQVGQKYLDQKSYHLFTRAVAKTFATPTHKLDKPSHVLFEAVYGQANLHHFKKNLEEAGLSHVLKTQDGHLVGGMSQEIGQYFKRLNQRSAWVVLAGVVGSAYISGAPVQWMNDHWLRQGLGPWLLNRIHGKETSSEQASTPQKNKAYEPEPISTLPLSVPSSSPAVVTSMSQVSNTPQKPLSLNSVSSPVFQNAVWPAYSALPEVPSEATMPLKYHAPAYSTRVPKPLLVGGSL